MIFAVGFQFAAFAVLWAGANLLSAVLAFSAAAFYVGVYTLWLKRTSRQNIVIGGAAGAVPVLVGWSAVQNSLGWEPLVLFVVMFLWTPPHFWALAVKYADDYSAADVPMLPAVAPMADVVRQMVIYTVALVRRHARAVAGGRASAWIYGVAAVVLGADVHLGHGRPRQESDRCRVDASVRLLDHLRHAAVRRDDARRLRRARRLLSHRRRLRPRTERTHGAATESGVECRVRSRKSTG